MIFSDLKVGTKFKLSEEKDPGADLVMMMLADYLPTYLIKLDGLHAVFVKKKNKVTHQDPTDDSVDLISGNVEHFLPHTPVILYEEAQ